MYAIGYALCFCMLRIEQEADQEQYTKGDRVVCVFLSLLSFLAVMGLLIAAWVGRIKETGYWNRPVNKEDVVIEGKPHVIETESLNEDDE